MPEFEAFDPTQEQGNAEPGDTEEFEEFDVMQEPPKEEIEVSIESLGGLAEKEDELKSLSQARDELEKRLLIDPGEKKFAAAEDGAAGFGNITGIAIAEKEIGNSPSGQLAVVVFVRDKVSPAQVASEALVPASIGGVPTDVQVTGELWANGPDFRRRHRPAPCGVSIGHCNMVMAGTLGCLVTRANQLFILSNNHVIALVNRGPIGVGIPQPGRLDGGVCPGDIIARLTQFVTIQFGGAPNLVDAAIARTSPNLVDRRMLRLGGVRQRLAAPVAAPVLNMQVQKSGRTTQYTRGIINAINATVDVSYAPLGGVARFTNQFGVRGIGATFSDRGDSGSLVTTFPANRPVGLLFAGNAAFNRTFCNDIRRVLAAFAVSVVF